MPTKYRTVNFKKLTEEEQKEIKRGYYEKRKEAMYRSLYEDVHCEVCDKMIKRHSLSRHNNTIRHRKLVAETEARNQE